jgi:hypothetical protein
MQITSKKDASQGCLSCTFVLALLFGWQLGWKQNAASCENLDMGITQSGSL